MNRPVSQVMEVESVNGTSVSFTTPLHIAFRTGRDAQLSRYGEDWMGPDPRPATKWTGVEDLYLEKGSAGNIQLEVCAYCWVKNVESSTHGRIEHRPHELFPVRDPGLLHPHQRQSESRRRRLPAEPVAGLCGQPRREQRDLEREQGHGHAFHGRRERHRLQLLRGRVDRIPAGLGGVRGQREPHDHAPL